MKPYQIQPIAIDITVLPLLLSFIQRSRLYTHFALFAE